jgi:nitroreductase
VKKSNLKVNERSIMSSSFLELIRRRRSIRRFKPNAIEPEKVELLQEAALRAPSSRGFNPWQFIFVDDSDSLERLSRAKPHGAGFLKNAPLGVVVCADSEKSDVWVEDAAIATIFIQLAAHSLGLGSCWIQIRKRMHDENRSARAYIAGLLDIPENLSVASMVAVGYPAEEKAGHGRETLETGKIFRNHHGSKRPRG